MRVAALSILLCAGMAAAQTPAPAPAGDADPRETYRRAGGSLFGAGNPAGPSAGVVDPGTPRAEGASFYSIRPPEPRRIKQHDLITVIIREVSDSSSKSSTDLKKTADFNALLSQYFKISLGEGTIKGKTPAVPPQLQFNMDRNFKGEGQIDRSDSLTARVQAEVIDVKPNGTLVIQATKSIRTDEEEQQFVLTGMVRGDDVTADNSVLSTQLADLKLVKSTKGAARDTSKRGFIPRFFDKLNPF